MAAKQGPNLGLSYGWALGESNWNTGNDASLLKLDAVIHLSVLSIIAAPVLTANGTRYIVGASPTGAFAGKAGQLAVRINAAWTFYAPVKGWRAWVEKPGAYYRHDGTNWVMDVADVPVQPFLDVSNPGVWTFTNAAWTKVPMYTVNSDTAAGWDTATNDGYTVPKDGLYMLRGVARPIRSGTGLLPDASSMALGVGPTPGDDVYTVWGAGQAPGVIFALQVTRVMRLTAGSKVYMYSKHSHTAAVGFSSAALTVTRLSA